ncbi:hypothetical protein DTB58_38540 [Streptomyces griseus]|nr:hypothetical protein [Streptomyces griseus]
MTTRCPFSDPQDPVSRVFNIRGQGPHRPLHPCPVALPPFRGANACRGRGTPERVSPLSCDPSY